MRKYRDYNKNRVFGFSGNISFVVLELKKGFLNKMSVSKCSAKEKTNRQISKKISKKCIN